MALGFLLDCFLIKGYRPAIVILIFFMPINKYLSRLHQLDSLIQRRATGTPKELAHKMGLSVSLVYRYINVLRDFGAPVRWCAYTGSYVYDWEGKLEVKFTPTYKVNNI